MYPIVAGLPFPKEAQIPLLYLKLEQLQNKYSIKNIEKH